MERAVPKGWSIGSYGFVLSEHPQGFEIPKVFEIQGLPEYFPSIDGWMVTTDIGWVFCTAANLLDPEISSKDAALAWLTRDVLNATQASICEGAGPNEGVAPAVRESRNIADVLRKYMAQTGGYTELEGVLQAVVILDDLWAEAPF